MGRPEPCVLFAQTFVHPQLDEYVDEVIFGAPIVITACEFLEQGASSASSAVTIMGATSPPSFALEVFIQCEGETRFRRLCQPFLYSHSSSNVLEVEAVVTNHLVVRGSYRSLSLIIYGNTAADLGQFNIEFDLDSSLTTHASSPVEELEELPPLLHQRNIPFEDLVFSSKVLSLSLPSSDICIETRRFLQLIFKILDVPNLGDLSNVVLATVASTASSFFMHDLSTAEVSSAQGTQDQTRNSEKPEEIITEARNNLLAACKKLSETSWIPAEFFEECSFIEYEADVVASKELVDLLFKHFPFNEDKPFAGLGALSKSQNVIMRLSLSLLLCSGRECCFHFVNGGGLEQVKLLLKNEVQISLGATLMVLGIIEQATRHSVGCEGLLGWWPREDEVVPSGVSEGYSLLLNLLMQKQRHDVASLTSYILHRLRLYEIASRFEHGVLSVLESLSRSQRQTTAIQDFLRSTKLNLKKILKLINSYGPVEDPSPLSCAHRLLVLGQTDGVLSYKATSKLITASSCRFLACDIDSKLLSLLKERGFLPLLIALFASSKLRAELVQALDVFLDITSSIEAIVLSLLFCRSGLVFLQQHPELSRAMIHALKGTTDINREECIPMRYAYSFVSKGFFCCPQEIGLNVEMHLRVVNAIDCLLASSPQSEGFLSVLWELCALSRSDFGRQALLALVHFPEAIKVLIEALHSAKDFEAVSLENGTPLNLAIFHSAADMFESIVTDPTAPAMNSWIEHALDLHKALLSSSPGSNRKDAPARLLEWIDAGVVYHKSGAVGLIIYASVLASGGDAPLSTSNILVPDSVDDEKLVSDAPNATGANGVENLLGKLVSEKTFEGILLRDSSVAQLTTALRILAFISENSDVAAALYDAGAMTLIYVVLLNCRLMFERSSNNYDYLVDDGTESNSTSDLLLERNREKCFMDLITPSLLLLVELLRQLKDSKEQHRNTKLMNALLRLHHELSPKLVASAADVSSYTEIALGLETVCHLLASALAFWPVNAWAPGLFHTVFNEVHRSSSLALGPKEACSLLCLLNDLLPAEHAKHWKNEMPLLTASRSLAVGSLLGLQTERGINWYLQPVHVEDLVSQLMPHLEKLAQVVLHYAVSTLTAMEDILRVLIIRIACKRPDNASVLVRPIITWISNHLPGPASLSELDAYKLYKYVDFLSHLVEHPVAKPLLLNEDGLRVLVEVLQRFTDESGKVLDMRSSMGFDLFSCCLPILKSFSLVYDSRSAAQLPGADYKSISISTEVSVLIAQQLFQLCQVLPVGRELFACLSAFKELASRAEGQAALLDVFLRMKSSDEIVNQQAQMHETHNDVEIHTDGDWRNYPLLCGWIRLYRSIEKYGPSADIIGALEALCLGALRFCMDGMSFDEGKVAALKYFFRIPHDMNGKDGLLSEHIKYIHELPSLLLSRIEDEELQEKSTRKTNLHKVVESAKSLSFLLQNPIELVKVDDKISRGVPLFTSGPRHSSQLLLVSDVSSAKAENEWILGELGDKFQWECPENLRTRLSQTATQGKRKMSSSDGGSRHGRENLSHDAQSILSKGQAVSVATSGSNRRDFRRKPNTSRPPSTHVDDYVARERNVDSSTNSNVIAVPRLGSGSGRAPSIHVDEFMARQRERHSSVPVVVGEPASQGKGIPSMNENLTEKSYQSKKLKVDLDDLEDINIVFDGEEFEPDDKLPFPQPDANAQPAATVMVSEQQSPQRSVVEETEGDTKSVTAVMFDINRNAQNDHSSRVSASHTEKSLAREPSITSDKKVFERPDETCKSAGSYASGAATVAGGSASAYFNASPLRVQSPADNKMQQSQHYYPPGSVHRMTNLQPGSQISLDQNILPSQPPLPPTPLLPTVSPVRSQVPDPVHASPSLFGHQVKDLQPLFHPMNHIRETGSFSFLFPYFISVQCLWIPCWFSVFQVQSEYVSNFNIVPASLPSSNPMLDTRYQRTLHSSPSASCRPLPPLPPTPPPFPSNSSGAPPWPFYSHTPMYNQPSTSITEPLQTSVGLSSDPLGNLLPSGSRLTYQSSSMLPPSNFSRSAMFPVVHNGSTGVQQQPDSTHLPHTIPALQLSIPAMQSSHLQPLQPTQVPRPPQPSMLTIPGLQQTDPRNPLSHSTVQMQMQPQQAMQQSHMPQFQLHYQTQLPQQQLQQQRPQQQPRQLQQQLEDSSLSLQQYFSSPQAIQSLLNDRDKLCQLLEQHPKLMQMLQEKLGQL
ncbi:virilizer-like protein [Drosera capensis]